MKDGNGSNIQFNLLKLPYENRKINQDSGLKKKKEKKVYKKTQCHNNHSCLWHQPFLSEKHMETTKGLLVAIAIKPQKRQQIIIRELQGSILDEQFKQAKVYK